mgnify:CR=1 FL=1
MDLEPKIKSDPPALYGHCVTVYERMSLVANEELTIEIAEDDERIVQVYEGFLTRLFEEVNLSVPYYTQVVRMLKGMNCINQIRRGGGTSPSRWVLLGEPTSEAFVAAQGIPGAYRGGTVAQTRQMLLDMNNRLIACEDRLDRIADRLDRLAAGGI